VPHFFDTNTLLYFASGEEGKANRIAGLLQERGWISVQVLNEAARVMVHKWKYGWADACSVLEEFLLLFDIAPLDIDTHRLGLDIAERYKISIFDSMIIAAALIAECDTLYSEDMQHCLLIDGRLRVINPFLAS